LAQQGFHYSLGMLPLGFNIQPDLDENVRL
jgi:hypothetical protein